GPAPSDAAASSTSVSRDSNTGSTVRTTNGRVTNSSATSRAGRFAYQLIPIGLSAPYRLSNTSPATIVGNANGMSINTSSTRLLGNWSRTNTQATTVPITALMAPTANELKTVSRIADSDWWSVTAFQKPDQPPPVPLTTTAASGSRTSRLSQRTATPRPAADVARNPNVSGEPPRLV